jgi:BlaI family transcriptional regulator, penicillinase repressor
VTSPDPPPVLHDLEREIMDEVWGRAEATVRDVLEAINARHERQRAYTTVMTVMQILAKKGLLTRRREGNTDVYTAVLDRAAYVDARAGAEVGALIAEFGDVAFGHFARQMEQLDPERRKRLRKHARGG